ncbi:MAG: BTAD domain-containing putative transcriptional regulator [Gammaproteobacteria bacterium]
MKHITASLAKTTRPTLARVLPRKRLFSILDRGRQRPVIWVTGPPGSGKTTLIASYIDSKNLRCTWYQIDHGDSDVATFFYYMGLATADQIDAKTKRLPLFTPEYQRDLTTFTRRYFQTVYEQIESPFALVFDGYHDIPSQSALHDVMRDALSEVPPQTCVIVISRSDPPPAMARLRANSEMEVLGWQDLRLTQSESNAIVKLKGLDLSEQALTDLYAKTQGWAAGLVLMLEQAKTEGSIAQSLNVSTPQLVFDYLAGEIFQKSDKRTQEFLLKTALLSQMTPRMAKELTAQNDAGTILAELSRNNYFTSVRPSDPEPIYEYHPLFKEFLLSHITEVFNENQRTELQREAAALLEDAGRVEDAVALLCEVGDWQQMTRIVNTHAVAMLDHGRGETLAQWLEDLPKEELQKHPWTLYWLGASRLPFAPRESRNLFVRAFELFSQQEDPDPKGLLLACSGAMDAILHELDDLALLDRWITELDALLKTYPDFPSEGVEARVTCSMFWSLILRQPDHPDIGYWLDRAFTVSRAQGDPNLRMSVELYVAVSYMWVGAFADASEVIDSMRKLAESPEVSPLSLTTLKYVESMYYMLNAEGEPCLKAVHDGLAIADATGVHVWRYQFLVTGAGGALGAGDLDTAEQLLRQVESHHEGASRLDMCLYHYYSAWYAMLRRDTLKAFEHQKVALKLAIDLGSPYFEVLCRLASAQVLVEFGEERKVIAHLRQVHSIARNIKSHLLEFMCLLSYAQMALEHGRQRSGLNSLRYALELGRQYGYRHFLWWRPSVMAQLCAYALDADIEVSYVQSLIQKRGLVPENLPVTADGWPWQFKIFTLGRFQVLKDERPLGFFAKLQRKPIELLKALIAFGGQEVHEDHLSEALWPRIDADYAHRSLTTTLHRLRKLLGEDKAIVLQDGRLSLNPSYFWIDTWAFEQVLEKIDDVFKKPQKNISPETITSLTERVFTLYKDPFMASEREQPWYVTLRERLRNKFLRYMGKLARYWEENGYLDRAVEVYQRSLEADDLAEGFYQRLMLCYRELGRGADAVDVYNRCRKTFLAVLKIEPSPKTKAIYEKLLHKI